jgi:hypothetical protein
VDTAILVSRRALPGRGSTARRRNFSIVLVLLIVLLIVLVLSEFRAGPRENENEKDYENEGGKNTRQDASSTESEPMLLEIDRAVAQAV